MTHYDYGLFAIVCILCLRVRLQFCSSVWNEVYFWSVSIFHYNCVTSTQNLIEPESGLSMLLVGISETAHVLIQVKEEQRWKRRNLSSTIYCTNSSSQSSVLHSHLV